MLIPCRKVERLPESKGSCWQIRIAEAGANFSDGGRWLPGCPELNFNVGLEKKKKNTMPAFTIG